MQNAAERHGVHVVAVDLDDVGDDETAGKNGSGKLLEVRANVADPTEVDAVVHEARRNFDRIDFVVNCAAVDRVGTIMEATIEDWDRIVGVNLRGVFLVCRAFIPAMRECGGGAIVNIGSTQGYVGGPRAALYCASKGGVHQLTRCIAIDHGDEGIRANCVAPGAIDTPMLAKEIAEHADPESMAQEMRDVPLGRIAAPEEIAAVACFLLSDEASYMTGSIVTVDGGEAA